MTDYHQMKDQPRLQCGPLQLVQYNGSKNEWAIPGGGFMTTDELMEVAKANRWTIKQIRYPVVYRSNHAETVK